MFFTCHCWSRTSPKRGGWTKKLDKWSLTLATMRSTKWRQFGTVRSMRGSWNQVIYQVSTTWFHGKDTRRKKIPGSQPQRSNTSESSSAHSTWIILTSRPRLLLLSTPHHRWLDRQSSRLDLPNESEDDQPTALTNELKRTELRLIFIVFLDKFGYLIHSTSSAALHVTARDCTWLPADLHQNFLQSLDFPDLLSISYKASVFLLELPLGQEVFHQRPSTNISLSTIIEWSLSGFPPQSFIIKLEGFSPATWSSETHQLPYRDRMFSLVSGFPPQSPNGLGGFSPGHTHTYTFDGAHVQEGRQL